MNIKFVLSAFLLLFICGAPVFAQKLISFETPNGLGYKDARAATAPPRCWKKPAKN